MGYKINLGGWGSVFAVPSGVVDNYIKLASGDNIKVLLFLLRHSGAEYSAEDIAGLTGVSADKVKSSVEYWRQKEIISGDERTLAPSEAVSAANSVPSVSATVTTSVTAAAAQNAPAVNPAIRVAATRDPQFNPAEIAAAVRADSAVEYIYKQSEILLGRPLKHVERNALMIVLEEIGLSPEITIMLVEYCSSVGKFTPRCLKDTALSWYESEIKTIEQAEEYIAVQRERYGIEYQLKKLFELNSALSKQQKDYIHIWTEKLGFDIDMLDEAYQATLNGAGKLSFQYMNKILSDWYDKGIKTREQLAKNVRKKPEKEQSSFSTDDLDALALERYKV